MTRGNESPTPGIYLHHPGRHSSSSLWTHSKQTSRSSHPPARSALFTINRGSGIYSTTSWQGGVPGLAGATSPLARGLRLDTGLGSPGVMGPVLTDQGGRGDRRSTATRPRVPGRSLSDRVNIVITRVMSQGTLAGLGGV